jgi:hypothetical protein
MYKCVINKVTGRLSEVRVFCKKVLPVLARTERSLIHVKWDNSVSKVALDGYDNRFHLPAGPEYLSSRQYRN